MIYDRLIMTHMANTKTSVVPFVVWSGGLCYFDLFSGLMEILDTVAEGMMMAS